MFCTVIEFQLLSDIAILSIEKNISKNLDIDHVVHRFSVARRNRRITLN